MEGCGCGRRSETETAVLPDHTYIEHEMNYHNYTSWPWSSSCDWCVRQTQRNEIWLTHNLRHSSPWVTAASSESCPHLKWSSSFPTSLCHSESAKWSCSNTSTYTLDLGSLSWGWCIRQVCNGFGWNLDETWLTVVTKKNLQHSSQSFSSLTWHRIAHCKKHSTFVSWGVQMLG